MYAFYTMSRYFWYNKLIKNCLAGTERKISIYLNHTLVDSKDLPGSWSFKNEGLGPHTCEQKPYERCAPRLYAFIITWFLCTPLFCRAMSMIKGVNWLPASLYTMQHRHCCLIKHVPSIIYYRFVPSCFLLYSSWLTNALRFLAVMFLWFSFVTVLCISYMNERGLLCLLGSLIENSARHSALSQGIA